MNFFERQRQVRGLSHRLVLLFALAVLGIVIAVNLAVVFGLRLRGRLPADQLLTAIAVASAVTIAVIAACSLVRTLLLRNGGGGRVARQLGGVYVAEDTRDPALRRLRNVVEEMAIASGSPVPEVYVLEHEPGINAFAAGWSTADAAVAVTGGALRRLNRDELQGVIAHEFSHVVNGDMRLNIRLIGLLFGILALAIAGRFVLYASRGGRKNAAPLLLIGIAALLAGYIGVFFGRLIKAAVSRQREYLADASAVQYTRQTGGLVGALKKIGGLPGGSKLTSGKVDDVSHMLFGDGLRLSSWFATHPPLPDRIRALDPTFDPDRLRALAQAWAREPPDGLAEDTAAGLTPRPARARSGAPAPAQPRLTPDDVVASVAAPAATAYRRAGAILDAVPEQIAARARRPDTVVPLIFGLLLAAHPEARARQHAVLIARHGRQLADATWAEAGTLAELPDGLRLPLAELGFSALRRRSRRELELVTGSVHALIEADRRLSVFEYCLSRLLHRELYEVTHRTAPWGAGRHSLATGSRDAVATLLSILAWVGHADPARAQAALDAGAAQVLGGEPPRYAPPARGVVELETVWPVLDRLDEDGKQRLVAGMVTVISHDQEMTVEEAEVLRTVCGVLHCPLPPLADVPAARGSGRLASPG